ncbi:hypothetical protein MBLNU459_g6054t1 [Dothideomycetes sp. NU459]
MGSPDIESHPAGYTNMLGNAVSDISWSDITVTVQAHRSGGDKDIVDHVSGGLVVGEVMALMGPSGSGKTTLLNVLARREAAAKCDTKGDVFINGSTVSRSVFQKLTSFVEQDDTLIGSLTVYETLDFAARLALPSSVSTQDRHTRVNSLIASFGLEQQRDTLIGTPIRKGISGGQKRRVSVASQLITAPKILFLDEPTSGLDSMASFEVIRLLKNYARDHQLIVIASIHQPSTTTFQLFDSLLLLSQGKTCYCGPVSKIKSYFDGLNLRMPAMTNPAEFLLELTNVDFYEDRSEAIRVLSHIQSAWKAHNNDTPRPGTPGNREKGDHLESLALEPRSVSTRLAIPITLLHRLLIKSFRDVVTYWIRVVMYIGLAIMMGTVWLRLKGIQEDIQAFINALFFGSAFMSFMAVAYIPAYLEDRATFIKERSNGLYGAVSFMVANFVMGLPFLFMIALLFSIVTYWLIDLRSGATAFFVYLLWLFLDLVAAESLVVLVASLFPNFIVSLALVAFANGLWMSVNGFLVPTKTLNVFWRYVFHYIDYQAYVFRGMLVNEFSERNYKCAPSSTATGGCSCSYDSVLADQCLIDGKAVLSFYDYSSGGLGKTVGIMIAIIVVYRALGLLVLYLKKT